MRVRTVGVLSAVVASALLAGCGFIGTGRNSPGGDGPSSSAGPAVPATTAKVALATAADATTSAKTATVTSVSDITAAGRTVHLTVSGPVALDGSAADLTVTLPGGLSGTATTPLTMHEIVVNGVLYLDASALPGGLKGKWLKLDLKSLGLNASKLTGGATDFASQLAKLKAYGNVTTVGQEVINGQTTTHYQATVDLSSALKDALAASGTGSSAITGALGDLKGKTADVNIWVNGAGLVVQTSQQFDAKVKGQALSVKSTTTFEDFGAPVGATAPDSKDVIDLGSGALANLHPTA